MPGVAFVAQREYISTIAYLDPKWLYFGFNPLKVSTKN